MRLKQGNSGLEADCNEIVRTKERIEALGRGPLELFEALNSFVESCTAEAASPWNPKFDSAGDSKPHFQWRQGGGRTLFEPEAGKTDF